MKYLYLFKNKDKRGNMPTIGITLECNQCKERNYRKEKNPKSVTDKLELNKYCPRCKKQTLHKEIKGT